MAELRTALAITGAILLVALLVLAGGLYAQHLRTSCGLGAACAEPAKP